MNRLSLSLILIVLAGCSSQEPPKDVVAKVGSYVISKQEFEEEYKDSSYGAQNTPTSRRDFLNNMINQKLILLDAQKRGLDKQKDFLKMEISLYTKCAGDEQFNPQETRTIIINPHKTYKQSHEHKKENKPNPIFNCPLRIK